MRCTEARDWLPVLVGGQVGLTEWALVETHLSQCVECRQDEVRLRRLVTRIGVARSTARDVVADLIAARLRPWPASARELIARTSARASRGIGFGVTRFVTAVAHLRAAPAIPRRLAGRAVANALEALRLDIPRTVTHAVGLCSLPAIRLRPSVRAAGTALALALARLRPWPASARELTARTSARAIRGIGFGVTRFVTAVAHFRAALAIPRRLAGRAVANALEALRLDIPRTVTHAVRLCSLPAIRLRPSVRAAGTALALALALYALQRSYGAQPHVRPVAAPGPGPVQIVPPLPAPSVEPTNTSRAPSLIDDRRRSQPRAAARSSARASASGAARAESLSPVPDHQPAVSVPHVVGRLSAKDWSAAERDFTALLAVVGGTELGRSHRDRFTAVQVVVPKSRYDDFAQGLARIGFWRPEAAFFPLPDAVHMTIRVSE